MSAKLYLSLVFHNHQPVGNFDFVFQEAYEKSYLPLVEALERHPKIKCGMHFTGSLRDWIIQKHPDLYTRVRALVDRGQLEVLGGGYYEPILVMLSDEDKIGQINKLSAAVEADTGHRPQGMWLAERVWEPSLAKPIAQAGIRYSIVDDTHFNFAGYKDDELYGYFVTEEQGYTLNMFPTSKMLRYLFPWHPVDEVMTWLEEIASNAHQGPTPIVVMGDDGEKFGLWPGTFQKCWVDGYVDEFFERVEAASDWLETIAPGEYLKTQPALGRAYLPTASYMEMTEWSLPPERQYELTTLRHEMEEEATEKAASDPGRSGYLNKVMRYMRGGFWRNFMVKYPEINHMQKRAMYTSARANALPDGPDKTEALARLWAAQCNCGYWHGLFGGIYLYHIRAANYANLLEAEARILDDKVHVDSVDFDRDSQNELVVNSNPFSLVIDPARGGAVFEWDDIPSRYNLLNIMTRHKEGYHADLAAAAAKGAVITPDSVEWGMADNPHSATVRAKEANLEQFLIADWHQRGTFIDHFLREDVDLEQFRRAFYGEEGDFVLGRYTPEISGSGTGSATVTLSRDGHVWVSGVHQPVSVKKTITVTSGKRELTAEYTVTNKSSTAISTRFAVEASYGFDGGDSEYCKLTLPMVEEAGHMGKTAAYDDVSMYSVSTRIRGFEVAVEMSKAATLWRFPLEPVTISEAGFERIHQGAVFLHIWRVTLEPGASWTNRLRFDIRTIPGL